MEFSKILSFYKLKNKHFQDWTCKQFIAYKCSLYLNCRLQKFGDRPPMFQKAFSEDKLWTCFYQIAFEGDVQYIVTVSDSIPSSSNYHFDHGDHLYTDFDLLINALAKQLKATSPETSEKNNV